MTSSTKDSSIRNGLDAALNRLKMLVTDETFLYVVKRLLQALLTLLLASAVSFAIIQLAPGDYLDTPQAES
jgi:peptide/nickel transport system permease protein